MKLNFAEFWCGTSPAQLGLFFCCQVGRMHCAWLEWCDRRSGHDRDRLRHCECQVSMLLAAFNHMSGCCFVFCFVCLLSRSAILITWCNFGIWYFISDIYHMYDVYCAKKDIFHLPLSQRVMRSVRAKWLYIFHHIFSFLFGYLIVVVSINMK